MSILKVGLEKGEEIGKEIGKEIGIRSMIEMCQECDGTLEMAMKKLQEIYALNEEQAKEKLGLYWKK